VTGARFEPPDPPTPSAAGLSLSEALEQFITTLQQAPPLPPPPDHATTSLLLQWLQVRITSLCSRRPAALTSIFLVSLRLDAFALTAWKQLFDEARKHLYREWIRRSDKPQTILKACSCFSDRFFMKWQTPNAINSCGCIDDRELMKWETPKFINSCGCIDNRELMKCEAPKDVGGFWWYRWSIIDEIDSINCVKHVWFYILYGIDEIPNDMKGSCVHREIWYFKRCRIIVFIWIIRCWWNAR
jgi:hypothetical protein